METTVLTVTDRFNRTKEFYNSDKHIVGDTRLKVRCNPQDYIWQFLRKEDYDGIIMDRCIAIDVVEYEDLLARGVKFYEWHYTDGAWYRISLEDFKKWSHPISGKFGSQLCASWRHFRNNLDVDESDTPPTKNPQTTRRKKKVSKIVPLRDASERQMGFFA